MKSRGYAVIVLTIVLVLTFVGEAEASRSKPSDVSGRIWSLHKRGAIAYLNPDHLWYNYSDFSVYWNASPYEQMYIDLDGTLWQSQDAVGPFLMRTVAVSSTRSWSSVWGDMAHYGIGFISPRLQYFNNWFFFVAENGIKNDTDGDYVWHKQASENLGAPIISEWFCYEIVHPTLPTDYLVRLQSSNGVEPVPVLSRFWYFFEYATEDQGRSISNWRSFTP